MDTPLWLNTGEAALRASGCGGGSQPLHDSTRMLIHKVSVGNEVMDAGSQHGMDGAGIASTASHFLAAFLTSGQQRDGGLTSGLPRAGRKSARCSVPVHERRTRVGCAGIADRCDAQSRQESGCLQVEC